MSEEREAKSGEGTPEESAATEAGESATTKAGESATAAESAESAEGSETSDAAADEAQERAPERVDEDGLPLDRDATIDDVRSKEARHSRIALGCTLVILLLIAAFFVVRAGVLG